MLDLKKKKSAATAAPRTTTLTIATKTICEALLVGPKQDWKSVEFHPYCS